jgi:NADH-ubiquinone oxidoreductase chain 5
MGGLIKIVPYIYINMTIASLALSGFPFLSGFYSKDLIIESANTKFWVGNQIFFWLTIISAVLTCIYSFRLLEQVFWLDFSGFKFIFSYNKITKIEIFVLGILCILSVTSGYLFKDIFLGMGSNYFTSFITVLPSTWCLVETEFLSNSLKVLPVTLTILAFEIDSKLFQCKWFYNEIINGFLIIPALVLSRHSFEQYDKLLIEYNGPLFFQTFYTQAQYKT